MKLSISLCQSVSSTTTITASHHCHRHPPLLYIYCRLVSTPSHLASLPSLLSCCCSCLAFSLLMAEVTQSPASSETRVTTTEVVTVEEKVEKPAVTESEKSTEGSNEEAATDEAPAAVTVVAEELTEKEEEEEEVSSIKEESNVVVEVVDPEKKALDELKQLIVDSLTNNEFVRPPPTLSTSKVVEKKEEAEAIKEESKKEEEAEKPEEPKKEDEPIKEEETSTMVVAEEEKRDVVVEDNVAKTVETIAETVVEVAVDAPAAEEQTLPPPPPPQEEIFIWGVPLVNGGEKTDTILLKFLRARDFKGKDALTMIKNTVIWRKEFGIEELLEEDLEMEDLEKVVFMHGLDKEGHPVCYNAYGEFQEKELYQKAFGDEEKRKKFLRWRVQVLEKAIREKLDFGSEGVCSMVQVTDWKNSPGLGRKELRHATNQALNLLQDNYPEFASKQIFINVPWWHLAKNKIITSLPTQKNKSKFVLAGPSKSAEILFKYIAPEQVPVQYGGLGMQNNTEFCSSDAVIEVSIKPSSKHVITIPVTETCQLVWELRVLGWDVSYGAEFVPDAEDGYTVIIQKTRKFIFSDDSVEKNRFKVGEPGKVVLTVENATSKKKKLLYRSKTKNFTDSYEK